MRGPSVQGARRSAPDSLNSASVLERYVEHGEQAQHSPLARTEAHSRTHRRFLGLDSGANAACTCMPK